MIEVETGKVEVEVVGGIEATSTGSVDVEVVDLGELDVTVAKKEYTITGDDIYIPVLYDDAPQWMKDLVTVVVDVTAETSNTQLLNQMIGMLSAFATSYVPLNQYTQSIVDLSDEDTRMNLLIETLNSNFNDGLSQANAQIISLESTKASKTEVIAQVLDTIAVQLASPTSSLGATIARLDQALVDESTARANSMEVLIAQLDNLGEDVSGSATAVNVLNTYVGIENGTSNSTGLLADVAILQKQSDGIIETVTGTYDVMLNPQDPNLAELVLTAEPYASWKAADSTGINTRLAHIGDVYIKYSVTANGAREYIGSYKFIRTEVDTTDAHHSTDADGFTWALIVDQAAQDAYTQALNAYELADGKITSYYMETKVAVDAMSNGWTTTQKSSNVGDLATVWNDSTLDYNGTWRWNGASWVNTRDKKLVSLASDVTTLRTDLDSGTGTWATADSAVSNTLSTTINNGLANVESKWAYNSTVSINGVYKKSGFGLTTNYTSGSGTVADPYVSEFWIDASRMKFTNSMMTGSVAPFTIDASDTTPQITFNGKVSFTNVTGYVPPDVTGSINSNNDIFAKKLGYASYAAMVAAAESGSTVVVGGHLNTELITVDAISANQIDTTGLIAENISANEIVGKTLTGAVINGAVINGAVVKASYLDLDGELEVITNYHITPAMYNANPALYTDAVYMSGTNEYRIPSMSTVRENFSINNIYGTGTYYGVISSYNTANVGNNLKAVKIRPTFISSTQMTLIDSICADVVSTQSWSNVTNNHFKLSLNGITLLEYYCVTHAGSDRTAVSVNGSYFTGFNVVQSSYTLTNVNIGIGLANISYTYTEGDIVYDNIETYPNQSRHNITVTLKAGEMNLPFDWTSGKLKFEQIVAPRSRVGDLTVYPAGETNFTGKTTFTLNQSLYINNMI